MKILQIILLGILILCSIQFFKVYSAVFEDNINCEINNDYILNNEWLRNEIKCLKINKNYYYIGDGFCGTL